MFTPKRVAVGCGLVVFCLAVIGACRGINGVDLGNALPGITAPAADGTGGASDVVFEVSQGRKNADKAINNDFLNPIRFDILQYDSTVPLIDRCMPLGDPGVGPPPIPAWPTAIFGPYDVAPTFLEAEYDFLFTNGETDYIVGLRIPVEPVNPNLFTQVEINFRAVNPFATGHAPATKYQETPPTANHLFSHARFPSNDDTVASRSLIDLTGGDVAILVQGIRFNPAPTISSTGYMNGLGPAGWVHFMRDNAFQSGRFYNLTGVLTGAPRALVDDANPNNDGFFQSVQVNGDNFDANSEPVGNMIFAATNPQVCIGGNPTQAYAFQDRSNVTEDGVTPAVGRGGFLLVIRADAFSTGYNPVGPVPGTPHQVVLDPSANPFNPPAGTNLFQAPSSGYDEPNIPGIQQAGQETDHAPGGIPDGVPGVHELAASVFFVHVN